MTVRGQPYGQPQESIVAAQDDAQAAPRRGGPRLILLPAPGRAPGRGPGGGPDETGTQTLDRRFVLLSEPPLAWSGAGIPGPISNGSVAHREPESR